jgi:membrane protein DedA with SNARE-associated domain
MFNLGLQYGYVGIFIISLIGAMSIFFPLPDTLAVYALAGLRTSDGWAFNAALIAVSAGIGSAIGELSGYVVGAKSRNSLKEYNEKMTFIKNAMARFGSIVIFIFALTPLCDDWLFIPLGVIGYGLTKIIIPAILGKFLMNLIVVYAGRFSIEFISDIFGGEGDWVSSLIITAIGVAVFIIMFKVDWEKPLERCVGKVNR